MDNAQLTLDKAKDDLTIVITIQVVRPRIKILENSLLLDSVVKILHKHNY